MYEAIVLAAAVDPTTALGVFSVEYRQDGKSILAADYKATIPDFRRSVRAQLDRFAAKDAIGDVSALLGAIDVSAEEPTIAAPPTAEQVAFRAAMDTLGHYERAIARGLLTVVDAGYDAAHTACVDMLKANPALVSLL